MERKQKSMSEVFDQIIGDKRTLYVVGSVIVLMAGAYFFPDKLIIFVSIILALSLHEFGHAAMATKMGDPTPRQQGRLTLNPLAHLTLWGTMFIVMTMFAGFGFGWGKPVQTDPRYYKNYGQGRILVAIAGPAMNLAQAMLAIAIGYILFMANVVLNPWVHLFLVYYILINIVLMVFNLLPIPPLDGGHVLEMMLPWKLQAKFQKFAQIGMLILLGMMFLGVLSFIIGFFLMVTRYVITAGFGPEFVAWLGF